jgi:hypothetical protein
MRISFRRCFQSEWPLFVDLITTEAFSIDCDYWPTAALTVYVAFAAFGHPLPFATMASKNDISAKASLFLLSPDVPLRHPAVTECQPTHRPQAVHWLGLLEDIAKNYLGKRSDSRSVASDPRYGNTWDLLFQNDKLPQFLDIAVDKHWIPELGSSGASNKGRGGECHSRN